VLLGIVSYKRLNVADPLAVGIDATGLRWFSPVIKISAIFGLFSTMLVQMLAQTRINPQPADPVQAKVMLIMPIMFSIFFLFFPAGLVLYWVVQNLLSIVQQWHINRTIKAEAERKARR